MSDDTREQDLAPGDSISMSVTHQIDINGDPAWVKLGVNRKVQPNEDYVLAFATVNAMIQFKIIEAIEATAQTVIDWEKRNT